MYKVKWAQHEQQSAKIYKRFDKGTKHGKWKANEIGLQQFPIGK